MLLSKWDFAVGICWVAAHGTLALAGVGSSGGGGAQVCRNAQGLIQYAELLDLYEAKNLYGSLMETTGSLEGDYLQAVRNTHRLQGAKNCFGGPCFEETRVRKNLAQFMDQADFVSAGKHLPWLGDLGRTIAPLEIPGCKYEQLAIFHDDTNRISIDSEIWRALSTRDQAALVVHELYYKYERELRENTSENTRASVAVVFANPGGILPTLTGIPSKALQCSTSKGEPSDGRAQVGVSDFYLYPSFAQNGEPTGMVLQFTHLMGRPMLSQTLAKLNGPRTAWNIQLGDPERRENVGDYPVVWEKGSAESATVDIEGQQSIGWRLEVEYAYRKPVRLTLLKQNQVIESAFVDSCN